MIWRKMGAVRRVIGEAICRWMRWRHAVARWVGVCMGKRKLWLEAASPSLDEQARQPISQAKSLTWSGSTYAQQELINHLLWGEAVQRGKSIYQSCLLICICNRAVEFIGTLRRNVFISWLTWHEFLEAMLPLKLYVAVGILWLLLRDYTLDTSLFKR